MTLPRYNIRSLAALAAVTRLGSVTKAAQHIHLTQPAVTQAITRLEDELACDLFERRPDGMVPTQPARFLAYRAEAAVSYIGSPRVTGTQLRAFVALARHGTYSDAAREAGNSPASLHRAVADLSVSLGQQLVERRGKGVALTTTGRKRARNFGLAMAELRAGYDEVAAWKGIGEGRLVIGAMPLSRARWLPAAITRIAELHPRLEISVIEGSHKDLLTPLRDGEIDLILGALREQEPENLLQERVFDDCPQIIMRSGHPLSGSEHPSTSDLLNFPWIMSGRHTPLRSLWENMWEQCSLAVPNTSIECGSVLTIRELLLKSDALTLLSRDQLRVELEAEYLTASPPPFEVIRAIGLTTREGWRPTASQSEFVEALRSSAIV